MRYLLDTCVLIHYTTDRDLLSKDVYAILDDYENRLYISAETVRELVIQFNKGKLVSKYWKTAEAMINAIKDEFMINVLPLKEEHMRTYANLCINEAQEHNDPSDHVIISHAITNRLPLITDDTKFEFYKNQGLELIINNR
jgi:PIN domain nuclease of toxin-antitoxin system